MKLDFILFSRVEREKALEMCVWMLGTINNILNYHSMFLINYLKNDNF